MAEHKMLLESWIIILILAIAAYMFIRGHRKNWAGSVLPLMAVPFFSIVYEPVNARVLSYGTDTSYLVRVIYYAVLFAATALWAFFWARRLPAGKSRVVYRILAISFNFLLILLFLRDLVVKPFLGWL